MPSGKTALTSPVTMLSTDCEKSEPTSADTCSAEPLSICFYKFDIIFFIFFGVMFSA